MKFLFLILLLILGCGSSLSNLQRPDTDWEKANYYDLDGVVAITTSWGRNHLCTGILIKENIVLTAAHCLHYPKEDIFITYGCNNIKNGSCKKTRVKYTITHDLYRVESSVGHDIGMIITEEPVTGIKFAELYNDYITLGVSVLHAGFGRRNNSVGQLYCGMARIKENFTLEIETGRPGWLDPNPGDSGGPAYVLVGDSLKVVGILSRSRINKGEAILVKPIAYLDWIYAMISIYSQ